MDEKSKAIVSLVLLMVLCVLAYALISVLDLQYTPGVQFVAGGLSGL